MRRRCCSASPKSPPSGRSKPPTASWACLSRVGQPDRRSERSVCRHRASRSASPKQRQASLLKGLPAQKTARRGTSATTPSRAMTPASPAARRASRGRRRRGNLARAARAGRCAAPPGRGRTGTLARRREVPSGSWAWSETVLVTEDPDDPALRTETLADPSIARHVLFCGDPAALPSAAVGRCAVVTLEPVAGSNLTVLVDRHAATLHPMGLVVRPHLQSAETAHHIAHLIAPLARGRGADAGRRCSASRHADQSAIPTTAPTADRTMPCHREQWTSAF